jgi:hypothetical protein
MNLRVSSGVGRDGDFRTDGTTMRETMIGACVVYLLRALFFVRVKYLLCFQ